MAELAVTTDGAPIYRTQFDPSQPATLIDRVIETIATVEDLAPTELEPLYNIIDLDLLAAFVEHTQRAPGDTTGAIGISRESWTLLVHCDGRLCAYEPTDTGDRDETTATSGDSTGSA